MPRPKLPTDTPEGVERILTAGGRKRRGTVKLSPREERAIGVVSEVTGHSISTLLHENRVADLVRMYDRYVQQLKAS
jgi:hypothetical protein